MKWCACSIMWISVSIAVCACTYFTKSAWCLWAFLLLACASSFSNKRDDINEEDKN